MGDEAQEREDRLRQVEELSVWLKQTKPPDDENRPDPPPPNPPAPPPGSRDDSDEP